MNQSHLAHAIIAVLITVTIWAVMTRLDLPAGEILGAAVAIALYLGREITQHEYKLGIQRGWQWGQTLPVRWWEGLLRGWSKDSALDLIAPAVACLALVLAYQLLW
ncbi:hypothetical protein [Halomonas elongata]|uniref:hypothetical protein n=1 Tax=Halomonas elongata TaxID=2746 RepID=UPI0023AFEB0C|nr:hypothetical protein [Halomonas elongata]